jgi:hypothetical protein
MVVLGNDENQNIGNAVSNNMVPIERKTATASSCGEHG